MLIKKGPFFLVHLCIGFVFWIQTTSEDNTAQGLPTITYIIVTYISKRLNVSQVGILWYIDSSKNFLFFNELHLLFGIFSYSKASRYTASSCTDLDNARFWIGSKNLRCTNLCNSSCTNLCSESLMLHGFLMFLPLPY